MLHPGRRPHDGRDFGAHIGARPGVGDARLGRGQQRMMESEGVAFAVKSCRIEYFRPARLDDALEVRTSLVEVGGASLRVRQRVLRPRSNADAELLADMIIRLAVMDRGGKPVRLPADIRAALAPAADPARDMRGA